MFRNALFVTLVLAVAVGCSSKKDDPVVVPPPFGPSLIAVGDDGAVMLSNDALNWTKVTVTGTLLNLDLIEVVRVPNHANRRLVTVGRDEALAANDSEIWWSDDGGNTWTKAVVTLNATVGAHALTGRYIYDICFVNELDGYAIGNDNILLMTVDAGTNWTEMNMFSDGTTGTDVEIDLSYSGTIPPVQGTLITQTQTTPAATVTGTVVSYDDVWDYVVVTGVTGGTFNTTDNITWGTAETATVSSVDTTTWRYKFEYGNCIYAVQNTGTAPTGVTIWFSNSTSADYEGMWKIDGSAVAAGAARTYTWTTPTVAVQTAYTNYFDRFFFFDQNTGVACTPSDGVFSTQDGGMTWAYDATTDAYVSENWSEFWYIDNGATGWLYSLENDAYFLRVGITYSATATPPYQFDFTTNDWAVLDTTGTNNGAEVDDHTGVVLYNNSKVFAIAQSWGDWTYGSSIGNATFDDDKYSDPSDLNVGEVAANGSNPMYDKEIKINTTTYYLEHWCQR